MREPARDKDRLEHILNSINNVEEFIQGLDYEGFCNDKLHYYAIVKNIEIIGEAAYYLSKEFREAHTEVPWKMVCGMRHYIVHDYYQVDNQVVWEVATSDLPVLKENIKKYLAELEGQK